MCAACSTFGTPLAFSPHQLRLILQDNIPVKIISAIRTTYLTNEGFTPENAKKASPAAEGMCKWVHAMSSYDKVAKVVAPKKEKLGIAEASYQEVMVGLRAKQAELQVRHQSAVKQGSCMGSNCLVSQLGLQCIQKTMQLLSSCEHRQCADFINAIMPHVIGH
jgi:hypothetical protein